MAKMFPDLPGCLHGKRSGFTLAELVMVLAVMALFLVLGIPNMMSYRAKSMLRGAGLQVSGDLTGSRMEAIKQNCNVIVDFSGPAEYKIVIDKNCNNSHDPGEIKIRRNLGEKYPSVECITLDSKNIFNSRGAMNRMRTLTLQNSGGRVNIRISLSGRIQLD
jgi:prepilin-type N-terminal cleavage/methylation domain-containing protein